METELTFIEKVATVQSKINVPKTKNAGVPYDSRSAEQILAAAKPYLLEQGLAITLDDTIVSVEGQLFVKSVATVICSETEAISGTGWAELLPTGGMTNKAQATGATSSYARKYALGAVLGVDTGEDADDAKFQHTEPDPEFHTTYTQKAPLQGAATEKQIKMIEVKKAKLQASDPKRYEELQAWYQHNFAGKKLKDLSKADASKMIDQLNDKPDDLAEYSEEPF